ncbi:MAG: flagellin, partial [Shewanella sp.]
GDFSVKYLATQQGALNVNSANITDSAAHIQQSPNTYNVSFADNGAGGISATITGGSGDVWNVDPVDPAAPLSFNGMELSLGELPTAGDSFTLEAQSEVSILDSLNQAIALVSDEARFTSPAGQSELAQLLNNIDSGFNQLGTARAATGTQLKQLEHHSGQHTEEQLVNKSALTLLEDLDFAKAFGEFQKQQVALNAVSSIFSKINSVSLFDYL